MRRVLRKAAAWAVLTVIPFAIGFGLAELSPYAFFIAALCVVLPLCLYGFITVIEWAFQEVRRKS